MIERLMMVVAGFSVLLCMLLVWSLLVMLREDPRTKEYHDAPKVIVED